MANDRWLKKTEPAKNVSQSDVRRMQMEKQRRDAEVPPTVPNVPTPRTVPTVAEKPVAPERDFTRVANSIVRDAVAGGHFIGKSKQLYDFLYLRTRGAIKPVRVVTLTKPEMMKGSGIGAEKTLLKNVAHLKSIGLIKVDYTDGSHSGNSYEVYLPEEIGLPVPRTVPTLRTVPDVPPDRPSVPPVVSTVRDVGSESLESTTSGEPKTLIKTKEERIDDETTRQIGELFKRLEREVVGKNSASVEQWREMSEVLLAELKIAAARTTVSSAPSFLAEHLRRRLWKMDKKQATREGKELPDQTPVETKACPVDCPNCNGSGWWYPNGLDKGVAKCKHTELKVPLPPSD
jgi:hypothetical protein